MKVAPHLVPAEPMQADAFARFEEGAARKVGALCSQFVGTVRLPDGPPEAVEAAACAALEAMLVERGVAVVLVGGVPAHPGSMIRLAEWRDAQLLGMRQCGMFSMATAADLILPRLLTGERLNAGALSDLGHGGLLGREMRFRFPVYARDLAAPDG